MNRRKAKEEAMNNKRTWAELLSLVENGSIIGMSKINKSLTREQVGTIFKNMIAERDLTETPEGSVYSYRRDRIIISGDGLGIQNILREFA